MTANAVVSEKSTAEKYLKGSISKREIAQELVKDPKQFEANVKASNAEMQIKQQ